MLYKETDPPTFSRFSFAIEVEREEMRKIIMIKVILVIFWGGTFVSVAGGTFETAMPGTFHSVTGGTFETVLGGTIKPLQSKIGRKIEELVVIIQI